MSDKAIFIEFNENALSIEGNEGAFTVTSQQYEHIRGKMLTKTHPVQMVARNVDPINYTIPVLTGGTHSDTQINGGFLTLLIVGG